MFGNSVLKVDGDLLLAPLKTVVSTKLEPMKPKYL